MACRARALLAHAVLALAALPLAAADIQINVTNVAGQGFNDPTPATPVGGNTGTTIGAQRLNCFKEAARIWGELLPSDVVIKIDASFEALTCDDTTAVIGSAGTRTVHAEFPGAILPHTWYHQALANKLAGADQDPATSDIRARFNSKLGSPGCLTGGGFYYGLDGNHGNLIDLVTIVLHEMGHGLGFSTFTSGDSGEQLAGDDGEARSDVYGHYLADNTSRLGWDWMTNGQRQASAINAGNLVWTGTNATRIAAGLLKKRPELSVATPPSLAGTYPVGTAAFGPALASPGVGGTVVAASPADACTAVTNGSQLSGAIALIDRGTCTFVVKAKNAQAAGAIAVLIADNVDGSPPAGLGGTDATITIPAVRLTKADGATLRASLPATATLGLDASLLAGADNSARMQLYAPTTFSQGSSVSHFDTAASPNLLMEPFDTGDVPHAVDATLEAFRDIGWFGAGSTGGPGRLPSWLLPSSARASGKGGAFFTTDLTLANSGAADAAITVKFLGNNKDGREGGEKSFTLGAGKSVTYADVLGSLFGLTADFGAIQVTADSLDVSVLGQTSTPPPDGQGTFGQSVPAAATRDLVVNGAPRAIAAIREDDRFRTNLIVANATDAPLEVEMALYDPDASPLGTQRLTFQPLEMRQISNVANVVVPARRALAAAPVTNATLVLSTPTPGGAFAAYAASIDNVTNDPRTLLPALGATELFLPSSARASGKNNAFFTTDLTVANSGAESADVVLKFLGNNKDGSQGPEKTFSLGAGKSQTFTDVLSSAFGLTADFGAIRITATKPVTVLGQTSTPPPDGKGTFGQSVPAATATDTIVTGTPRAIPAVREDARFRTNLIVVNTTAAPLEIDVTVSAEDGTALGTQKLTGLAPLEMRQISNVVKSVLGPAATATNARLVLSTPTTGGAFAAYAAEIDNVTNDPRTLLPR